MSGTLLSKTLLIGTTGMLAPAARHLAGKSHTAVLAARHASAFSLGDAALDARLRRVDADYTKAARFLTLTRQHAPYDAALTWLRPHADETRNAIARMLARNALLVEVMGSGSVRAGFADRRAKAMRAFPHIRYAQLVLGFKAGDGESRWLTHEEISAAAVEALETGRPRTIAGQLEPWDKRP